MNTTAPVSTVPSPVHPHTEWSATDHVKLWAVRHETSYVETLEAFQEYKARLWNGSPWQVAIFAAAESLAGAERIAAAVAHAGMRQWEPNPVSTSGGGTSYSYKFAPSSHKSKHDKHCKLCEKRGRLCHIHAKRQGVTNG